MTKASTANHKLQNGILFSWLALLMLPVAMLLGCVGMCAGPESTGGASLMFSLGAIGILAAAYGAFRVVRGVLHGSWPYRVFGVISLGVAVLAARGGSMLAKYGAEAVRDYGHG